MINVEEQIAFYNKYWKDLNPFSSYKVQRIIKILEYLEYTRKQCKTIKILDLGCGDGRCVAIWNEIGESIGLDLSNDAIENASKRYPHIKFLSGDATQSKFKSESFNVIISQEVIEHIEDQNKYIDECNRLLKHRGFLILTTPNKYYFDHTLKGNYSDQPIEKIITGKQLVNLIAEKFEIIKLESMILGRANYGIYRLLQNKLLIKFCKIIGLKRLLEIFMQKRLLGLQLTLLARKK